MTQLAVQPNERSRAHLHVIENTIYLLEIETKGVSEFVHEPHHLAKIFNSIDEAKEYALSLGLTDIHQAEADNYDQAYGLATCS